MVGVFFLVYIPVCSCGVHTALLLGEMSVVKCMWRQNESWIMPSVMFADWKEPKISGEMPVSGRDPATVWGRRL